MINWTEETYPEPTQSEFRTGGLVLLVKTLRTGDTISEWMTPFFAVDELMFGSLNGSEVASGHIEWGEVSSGTLASSGGGFAAVWDMWFG